MEQKQFTYTGNFFKEPVVVDIDNVCINSDISLCLTVGASKVLCSIIVDRTEKDFLNYPQVTVNYIERKYSVGFIPTGHFREEYIFSDKHLLMNRLIERQVSSVISKDLKHSIYITLLVLSAEINNPVELLAFNAAAIGINLLDIPKEEDSLYIVYELKNINNKYHLNSASMNSRFELKENILIAASQKSVYFIEMFSAETRELVVIETIKNHQKKVKDFYNFLQDIIIKSTKKIELDETLDENTVFIYNYIDENYKKKITAICQNYLSFNKFQKEFSKIKTEIKDYIFKNVNLFHINELYKIAMAYLESKINNYYCKLLLSKKNRIDGRTHSEIRPLELIKNNIYDKHSVTLKRKDTETSAFLTRLNNKNKKKYYNLTNREIYSFFVKQYFHYFAVSSTHNYVGTRDMLEKRKSYRLTKIIDNNIQDSNFQDETYRLDIETTSANGGKSMNSIIAATALLKLNNINLEKLMTALEFGYFKDSDLTLLDINSFEEKIVDAIGMVCGSDTGINYFSLHCRKPKITVEKILKILNNIKGSRISLTKSLEKKLHKEM